MFDKPIHRKRAIASISPDVAANIVALPEQLIMPHTSEIHSAEPLTVELVSTMVGLARLPLSGTIVSIAEGELLDVLLKHQALFGVRVVVLAGVPDVEYTARWEQAVWGIERATYGDLVTELVAIDRVDSVMSKQGGSRQKPAERPQATITKPRNKHYDDFESHRVAGGDDMAEGEDDAPTGD